MPGIMTTSYYSSAIVILGISGVSAMLYFINCLNQFDKYSPCI